MAAVTRLGLHGGPRSPYGSFAGKAAAPLKTYTKTFTRLGLHGGPRPPYGSFAGKTQQQIEAVEEIATGGWLNAFEAYRQRKRAQDERRREVLRAVRELDGVDGEIARLMQAKETRALQDAQNAEFRAILDKEISKAKLDQAGILNERVNRAYNRAMKRLRFLL